MIANIISRTSYTLTDYLKTSGHEFKLNSEYDGKSQIVFHRKPKAEEDDFILIMDGKDIAFQGIISKIENESNSDAYKVTAVEMQTLFNQKVILSDESIKTETGIEDFIADQIRKNFIESDDELVNIDYLTVTALTHTPIAAAVSTEDGIYNLKTYISNAMTMYGVFVDFEFTNEALNIVVEKRQQGEFKIDATLPDVLNLTEVIDYKILTKLTVIWKLEDGTESTHQFFLKTDRTITTDMEDEDRAKGTSDIIVSTAETEEAMIQEAYDAFTSNSYNHKVTFDVSPNSKMIPAEETVEGFVSNRLPSGYEEIEYIESTGTQYVDTGFTPTSNSRIVADTQFVSTPTANYALFGSRNADDNEFWVYWRYADNCFVIRYGTDGSGVYLASTVTPTNRNVIDMNKNVLTVADVSATNSKATADALYPAYLFAVNAAGTASYISSLKMYACQIYDNDTLVRDYIPCKNNEGEFGLYDLVEGKFYGNAGTGVFIAGSTWQGASIEVKKTTTAITADNITDWFTVTNNSYYFKGDGSVFTTTNGGVSSSTAKTVLTALKDMDVSFSYSYSSETSYDKFTLIVAGTTVENAVSGSTTVKTYSGSLATGETITFQYVKDGSQNSYDDKCTFYGMEVVTEAINITQGEPAYYGTRTIKTLYVGKVCAIKTKSGVKTSIITAMELSSDSNMISLIFGNLKVTLIEKLKGVEARK